MTGEKAKRGSKAIHALQRASRFASMEPAGLVDEITNRAECSRASAEAEENLRPSGELVRGAGEVAHVDRTDIDDRFRIEWLVDTLKHPNMIGVDASQRRLEAAENVGALEAAADAAESAQAANSLEKMLCHQMAAAHFAAMKLLARAGASGMPPVEMARLSNSAARMMDVYQAAFLTLQKIRTGGKQVVVVQHVQVSDGGQAVIAGNMKAGGASGGGGSENA
jgi:hypothetical protein